MCGEGTAPERAIVGDAGAICVDCVWMCVDILEERGEKRPEDHSNDFEADETSQVYERGTLPPPK
jgi:hypothetical protein